LVGIKRFVVSLQTKILNNLRNLIMILIPVTEGESIERAIKKYKRKFEKTGILKELRNRKDFKKPSVLEREQYLKAKYIQHLRNQSF